MKKLIVAVLLVVILTLAMSVPAFAIVHPVTPSDDCSGGRGGGTAAGPSGAGAIGPGGTSGVGAPVPGSTGVGSDVPGACD